MVDFRKAFDYIVYDNLWRRLIEKGVTGKTLAIIKSMYRQLKNHIRGFNGDLSDPFHGAIGLRQGESLSPFLFSLIVNDIEADMRRNTGTGTVRWGHLILCVLMYADDMCILASTPDELQSGLNILDDFCCRWNLIVNCDKTEILIFQKTKPPTPPVFVYRGTELPHTGQFKYLGIMFDGEGKCDMCIETLCGQARKATMALRQRFRAYEFTPHEKYGLYLQLVEPILSYGSEVWGYERAPDMEILHRKFIREILGVRKSTRNDLIYYELGTIPLRPHRLIRMVTFWAGLDNPASTKLSSKVCKLQRESGRVSWSTHVRDALIRYGSEDAWLHGTGPNIKSFTESFKSEVWKREQKLITSNIATGTGQTRFYQFLTNDSHGKLISPWYMRNIDRNNIKTLTQFRLCSNNLAVVKDAWRGVAIENRLCTNCHQIDDEVHFISECKLLEGLRRKYLPEYIRQSRNTVNTINLLRSEDCRIINNLCIFIKKGMKIHDR